MKKKNIEIERKFLIKEIPFELNSFNCVKIKQGYISTDPVIRLRQKGDNFIFTFKDSGQVKRVEFEFPLSEKQFTELWGKVTGNTIVKKRYFIPLNNENNNIAELDIYEEDFAGFKNVEVEFSSEEEAVEFTPPDWFGEDISFNPEYSNAHLSIFGLHNEYNK